MAKPKLKFDEVREGQEFAAWERGNLNIELFQAYGEASGDGNPMHTDEEYARDLGYPGVFAQGMLIMAFAAKYLTDLFGVGAIQRIHSRFRRQTWPGETLRFVATVTKKSQEGGKNLVTVDLKGANREGEEKLLGEAVLLAE
jgi:acyl dehydratase